jgi:hypothetical protein
MLDSGRVKISAATGNARGFCDLLHWRTFRFMRSAFSWGRNHFMKKGILRTKIKLQNVAASTSLTMKIRTRAETAECMCRNVRHRRSPC